jgi:hypothetical protein
MWFEISETANTIEYTLVEKDGITGDQLKEFCRRSFFTLENGVYVKKFPRADLMFPQDLQAIQERYNIHQQKAFTSGFTKKEFVSALEWVAGQLRLYGIRWWLIGSGMLFVRGLDVHPRDLDIITYKTEIRKIEKAFTPYIIEPFCQCTDWVVKGYGCIDHSFEIGFGFEPEDTIGYENEVHSLPYAEKHLEPVNWKGYDILVPPLETEILANKRRNRTHIVKMIKERLSHGK